MSKLLELINREGLELSVKKNAVENIKYIMEKDVQTKELSVVSVLLEHHHFLNHFRSLSFPELNTEQQNEFNRYISYYLISTTTKGELMPALNSNIITKNLNEYIKEKFDDSIFSQIFPEWEMQSLFLTEGTIKLKHLEMLGKILDKQLNKLNFLERLIDAYRSDLDSIDQFIEELKSIAT